MFLNHEKFEYLAIKTWFFAIQRLMCEFEESLECIRLKFEFQRIQF